MLDVSDIVSRFRKNVGDPELPGSGPQPDEDSLWATDDIVGWIDQAQKEFAEETLCFFDSSTFTVPVVGEILADPDALPDPIPYTPGEAMVAMDERIIDVRYCVLTTNGTKVHPITLGELEKKVTVQSIENDTGVPKYLITDYTAGMGRLYPTPVVDDTLRFHCYRYPLNDIEGVSDDFEITTDKFKLGLLLRVKQLAYSNDDADAGRKDSAEEFGRKWDEFIEKAKSRVSKLTRTPGVVKYGGIY